jgi:diguanylate cyclase (GGDEF)-like protein/hemerythrin-like metal-binding protein
MQAPHDHGATDALEASAKLLMQRGVLATAIARHGAIAHASARFEALFGMPGKSAGVAVAELSTEADRPRLLQALETAGAVASAPASGTAWPPPAEVTFLAQRLDGSVFEVELVAAAGALPAGPATILLVTDVTARRRAEKELSYLAFLDSLTGLPNRALFLDRLRETLSQARRDGRVFGVMMCDLDGFKKVNDTLGHEAGDSLLQTVAQRLEGAVRESDTVARQGGDEFAVILSRVATRSDAAIVAERIVRAFDAPIDVEGTPCKVGISIGIAAYPEDGMNMDALIGRADAAMYESKAAGKNRYTFAAPLPEGAGQVHVPFFRWSEAHAVGVASVDAQHRWLANLVNQLGDDLKQGRDRDAIVASLRALMTFTVKHFATEERLMEGCLGWPLHGQHETEHRRLVDELTSLTVNVDAKSMMITMRFLQEWLQRHIDTMDRPMGVWLRDHGVS